MDNILRDDLISRKEAIKLIEDMLNRPSIKANPDTANGLIGAHKIIWDMPSASDKLEVEDCCEERKEGKCPFYAS